MFNNIIKLRKATERSFKETVLYNNTVDTILQVAIFYLKEEKSLNIVHYLAKDVE